MKNWYIVQSHSSFENKVAHQIKEEAEKAKITEVLVPIHEVTEVKRGKRVQRKKKYFPSYVLVGSLMVFALATIAAIFFLLLDQILKFFLDLILTINF